MKLSNLKTQATMLMMSPILISDDEFANRLHIDEIDNFIESLSDGLPEKYDAEWVKVLSMPVNSTDKIERNRQSNKQVLAAHELLGKIHKWIESLSEYRDSPSFRSRQLNSVFEREIPALLNEGKDRKFIVENVCNFLDKLCKEFPPYADKIRSFRKEFVKMSKWKRNDSKFLNWCKDFSNRITVYFDNYCLEDEWKWHVARLNETNLYDQPRHKSGGSYNRERSTNNYVLLRKIARFFKKPYSIFSAVVLGIAAICKGVYEIITNLDGIMSYLGL